MYVTSTGMVCSVGLNAAASCAAIRCGITNFIELPYHDNRGEPIVGALVPGLRNDLKRDERLIELLSMALADCLQERPSEPLHKIPLLVGLAEPDRPGCSARMPTSIVEGVQEKIGMRFHSRLSGAITQGHTSGFHALGGAKEFFQDREVSTCLVCGVDSYINATSLLWLEQHDRLKTPDNSDGVIPGEAAAAVLLQREAWAKGGYQVRIVGLGFARENASVQSEEPLLGIGLAQAARAALAEAGLQLHDLDFRLSDMTGESYGFKEQALVEGRLLRVPKEEFPLWHCADSIGDTGAAVGMCEIVMADHAFRRGYAPGDRAISYTSAVLGDRASAVLQHVA